MDNFYDLFKHDKKFYEDKIQESFPIRLKFLMENIRLLFMEPPV